MADQQQLDLLRQGVTDWHAWRTQHPDIQPDLSGADLSGADLSGADLGKANLSVADLSVADLGKADLSGADLSRAQLGYADLSVADLSRAQLRYADLSKADLSEADLSGANLSGADLSRADLSEADLRYSDPRGADLSEADLSRADLSGADLRGANLRNADLSDANLTYTNLNEAQVGLTIFGSVDLRTVKGLETVRHFSPSIIGTDTLLRLEGNIPETFLRQAGLTDAFITYTRSLVQNPIEYYTCFISYSSQDQEFVELLYTDLQAKGVRCWYAPEDLRIREQFWHRIYESIRLHDKLLVVLSQHSVNSKWVEREVMAALENEQQQHKWVLFPITLDEAVMQMRLPWAASIQQTRHIGDFTHWKEHDTYQKGLMRLMRDLQPDQPPTSK